MKNKRSGIPENVLGYLMVAPALICIVMIAFYPILRTFQLSLTDMRMQFINKTSYVGFENYLTILGDSRWWGAAYNTVYFALVSVFFELIFGFFVALLMNTNNRGRGLLRGSVLIPWAIPTIISAMMWRFIFHDQFGILNDILLKLGIINDYVNWLGSAKSAMWTAIIIDVWKTTPFMALLILSGLQTIPLELYESATVDGAGRIRQLFSITLPLVTSTVIVALIFRTMDAFRIFDLMFILTGGGPANSTETLAIYAYKDLFSNLDFGMGSALAVTNFLIIFIVSQIYIFLLKRRTSLSDL